MMELTVQLYIVGITTALFLVFLRQLPSVPTLRWWLSASGIGIQRLLLQCSATALGPTRFASLLLTFSILCGCAQIYCLAQGLLYLQGSRRKLTYVSAGIGISLLLGFNFVAMFAGPTGQTWKLTAALSEVVLPIICGFLGFHLWTTYGGSRRDTWGISALLFPAFTAGLLVWAANLHALPQMLTNSAALSWSGWAVSGQCGLMLAMVYVVYGRDAELQRRSECLSRTADSSGCGICEFDEHGCVTSINPVASAMLAISDLNPVGNRIDEIIQPGDDKATQLLSQLILRPINPLRRGRGHIRRADGTIIFVEWSSLPIIRNGHIAGAVLTLLDVTDHVATDRFMHVRTELLEMIAHNKPVEDLAGVLATAVEARLPGFRCSVLVCDGDCFSVVAAPELPKGFRAAMQGLPCSRLVPASNSKRKSDLRTWEGMLREIGTKFAFGGTWIEPLVSSANEVLGTIVLSSPSAEPLLDEQNATLVEAARLASLAVQNQRWLQRLLHQGHHDTLTGLPNRLLFADRLKHALARAHRTGTQIALLCIDLDRFKYINDTLGHCIGDLFLQQVSVRLAARIRASDTLARTGGDEFAAVISDLHDQNDAEKLAQALIVSLRDPFEVEQHTLYAAVSIGLALYPQDGTDADSLYRNADRAMYRAKAAGRNTVRCYSGDDARETSERMEIELHLHRAVERGHFDVHFQPQFTCDRRLSGFEALLRFRHPKLGMVPPSRFIPIAEESGLILPIGEWVLKQVCLQIAEWRTKGMQPLRVAVNVSPLQFARADFCDTVRRVLQLTKVHPELLELELTEGVLMSTVHDAARQIGLINQIGVKLSVDDFGTGYSSLSYLHQLPIHILKIDREFINKMLEPGGTRAIVEAIISLAHGLGLRTVAEGVEQEAQLKILQAAGCDLIQGYIFSHPLPAVEASRLLWEQTMAEYGTGMNSPPNLLSYAERRYGILAPSTPQPGQARS